MQVYLTHIPLVPVCWVAKLLVPAQLSVRCLSQGGIKCQDGIKNVNLCIVGSRMKNVMGRQQTL